MHMAKDNKYDLRGVSADKTDVHEAIKHLDKGLFPNAFCKILPDIVGKSENAIVMNIDDMACVGAVNDILLSSTIGRNKHLITGDVISTLIQSAQKFCEHLKHFGVNIHLTGGETADVGDIVRTIDVGYTTFVRLPKNKLVVNNIKPGNVIVGLASYGKASYENNYNSGIGSNGLTSARHDVLSKYYDTNFKEVVDPNTNEAVRFTGSKRLTDTYNKNMVGDLLLSPTRTYLPVLKTIFEQVDKNNLHGIIHCTGGAQTKVLHFANNVHIIKDNLLPIPPVFQLIQEESGTALQEMFKVFNMGHRLEFYVDETVAEQIIEIADGFNIPSQVVGRVEAFDGKQVSIYCGDERLVYG